MTVFVIACTVLTYGDLALAIPPRPQLGWQMLAGALLLANPTILLYVGIVGKDVLFAALLCFCCGACLAASRTRGHCARAALAIACGLALLLAAHTRQQGLFLLPILAACPLYACNQGAMPKPLTTITWIGFLAIAFLAVGQWTDSRISHVEGHDRQRGLQRMLSFDIVGTSVLAGKSVPGTQATPEQLRIAYTPSRVDTLSRLPSVGRHLRDLPPADLWRQWRQVVSDNPAAYAKHRALVAAHVLNLRDLAQCLPLHVGIDGDPRVLAKVGLVASTDARDRWKYAASLPLRWTPWFRHLATLSGILLLIACAWRLRASAHARIVLWFALSMTGLIVATAALAIACDFRYLYPAIVVASTCALGLLMTPACQRDGQTAVNPED